jgi:hypothetical protein
MKKTAGLISLASFCAGTIWLEYELLSRFGSVSVLIAAASALAVLSGALFRAPEGYEGSNGLDVGPSNRRSGPTRYVRHSQRQVRRRMDVTLPATSPRKSTT